MIHEIDNYEKDFWVVSSSKSDLGIYQFCFFNICKENEFTTPASLYINLFFVVGGNCKYEDMDVKVGDVFLYGISKKPISSFSTEIELFSINISPMLLFKVFGMKPAVCSRQAVRLSGEHILTKLSERLQNTPKNQWVFIAESFLEDLVYQNKDGIRNSSYDCVEYVIKSLHEKGTLDINACCNCFGISRRHLQRKFTEFFGLHMKDYERIVRFAKAFCEVSENSLIETSLNCGYYDQSHMCREFRELAGTAPQRIIEQSIYTQLKETLESLEDKKT